MPGKSGELWNLIPGKFCHLEGNFALQNKEIHTNCGNFNIFSRPETHNVIFLNIKYHNQDGGHDKALHRYLCLRDRIPD